VQSSHVPSKCAARPRGLVAVSRFFKIAIQNRFLQSLAQPRTRLHRAHPETRVGGYMRGRRRRAEKRSSRVVPCRALGASFSRVAPVRNRLLVVVGRDQGAFVQALRAGELGLWAGHLKGWRPLSPVAVSWLERVTARLSRVLPQTPHLDTRLHAWRVTTTGGTCEQSGPVSPAPLICLGLLAALGLSDWQRDSSHGTP
jgi:hypothetical protein